MRTEAVDACSGKKRIFRKNSQLTSPPLENPLPRHRDPFFYALARISRRHNR